MAAYGTWIECDGCVCFGCGSMEVQHQEAPAGSSYLEQHRCLACGDQWREDEQGNVRIER